MAASVQWDWVRTVRRSLSGSCRCSDHTVSSATGALTDSGYASRSGGSPAVPMFSLSEDGNGDAARRYAIGDFAPLRRIGGGLCSKVLLVKLKRTGQRFAMKLINKADLDPNGYNSECVLAERQTLMRGMECQFISKMLCSFQTKDRLYFVMRYYTGGDLYDRLERRGRFDDPTARFYVCEIVVALQFLHDKNIIHRDVKLENVLLDERGHAHLADFGVCKTHLGVAHTATCNTAQTLCGTPEYFAPEVIRGERYDHTVDYWALGVLAHEMLAGRPPFDCDGRDRIALFSAVLAGRLDLPAVVTKQAADFIRQLLEPDPATRLGGDGASCALRAHAFFGTVDWRKVELRHVPVPHKPDVAVAADCGEPADCALSAFSDADGGERDYDDIFHGFSFANPSWMPT